MRRLAPLLLLLLPMAAPARAVPITGYALGRVTRDLAEGLGVPRTFPPGEAVSVRWTYDLAPTDPVWGNRPSVAFEVRTASGFVATLPFATASAVQVGGDSLRVSSSLDPRGFDLRLVGGVGTLTFSADLPLGSWGFVAAVERTDAFADPVATPEPAGWLLGLLGAAATAAGWRGRAWA